MSGLFRKENWMSRVAGGDQGKQMSKTNSAAGLPKPIALHTIRSNNLIDWYYPSALHGQAAFSEKDSASGSPLTG